MCVWESVTLRLQRASNIHVTNWSKTTFSSSLYLAFASFSNTAVWAHILCMCNLLSSWGTLGQQKQVSEWKWVSYTGNSRQLDSITYRFLCKWFLQFWHHYSAKTSWKKNICDATRARKWKMHLIVWLCGLHQWWSFLLKWKNYNHGAEVIFTMIRTFVLCSACAFFLPCLAV